MCNLLRLVKLHIKTGQFLFPPFTISKEIYRKVFTWNNTCAKCMDLPIKLLASILGHYETHSISWPLLSQCSRNHFETRFLIKSKINIRNLNGYKINFHIVHEMGWKWWRGNPSFCLQAVPHTHSWLVMRKKTIYKLFFHKYHRFLLYFTDTATCVPTRTDHIISLLIHSFKEFTMHKY